jgi:hypothetical protein
MQGARATRHERAAQAASRDPDLDAQHELVHEVAQVPARHLVVR